MSCLSLTSSVSHPKCMLSWWYEVFCHQVMLTICSRGHACMKSLITTLGHFVETLSIGPTSKNRTSIELHCIVSALNDYVHSPIIEKSLRIQLSMWRWSYDTPRSYPSLSSTAAWHGHHQQHGHMSDVVSSLVHNNTLGNTILNQCNVTWKFKRPTCNMKSHEWLKNQISQTVMRKVEQSQWSVLPFAINKPHLYMKKIFHIGSFHVGLRFCSIFFEEWAVAQTPQLLG